MAGAAYWQFAEGGQRRMVRLEAAPLGDNTRAWDNGRLIFCRFQS